MKQKIRITVRRVEHGWHEFIVRFPGLLALSNAKSWVDYATAKNAMRGAKRWAEKYLAPGSYEIIDRTGGEK